MRIHTGKYAYYWHLLPTIKLNLEKPRWYNGILYLSFEFGWLKWWVEIELING